MWSRSRKLRKALVVVVFFVLGELLGIGGFWLWLQIYGVQFPFKGPLALWQLPTYYCLATGTIVVPVAMAEMGSRIFDGRSLRD